MFEFGGNARDSIGFGLFWGWNLSIFWSNIVLTRPDGLYSGGFLRIESLLAIIATLLVLAVFCEHMEKHARFLSIFTAFIAVFGEALGYFGANLSSVLTSVGFAMIGIAYATWELLWATRYKYIPSTVAWRSSVPDSICVGVAVFLIAVISPPGLDFVLTILMPVASMVLFDLPRQDQSVTNQPTGHQASRAKGVDGAVSRRLLGIILVFGLVLGFVTEVVVVDYMGYTDVYPLAFLIMLAVLLSVTRVNVKKLNGSVFQFAHLVLLPLVATALLAFALGAGNDWLPYIATINIAVYLLGELYFWSILAAQTKLRHARPMRVFGLGQAFKVMGLIAGMVIVYYVQDITGKNLEAIAVVMLYLLVVAALFTGNPIELMYSESELVSVLENNLAAVDAASSDDRRNDDAFGKLSSFDEVLHVKCVSLAGEYGLSQREAEVLELLVSGFRLKAIAEELVVSENTIKVHTRHIYQKLNVHNRQELISLFKSF